MAHEQYPPDPMPKSLLLGALALMVVTFASAVYSTIGKVNDSTALRPAEQARQELRFVDNPDGSITVLDGTARETISKINPETNGFLRVVMRGLARERRLAGLGDAEPFLLYRATADQRLILEDPATGKIVGLDAFGPSNAGVFAALLQPRR